MKFTKRIELKEGILVEYFVDHLDRKQGTLHAYSITLPELIREEFLLYTQEFKDDLPVGIKIQYKLEVNLVDSKS